MCGIAGFNLAPTEQVRARTLASSLLVAIEHRGRQATGAAYYDQGEPWVQKNNVAATRFVRDLDMPNRVRNAILHTRYATQGSPTVEANNHPIDVGGIIGVHNGMVYNDDDLFDRLTKLTGARLRQARVDSEAIFATLLHGNEPYLKALSRIEGSAAVAWFDLDDNAETLHLARLKFSPLHYTHTPQGSLVFASTPEALTEAMSHSGLDHGTITAMAEGETLTVTHGAITHTETFQPYSVGTRRVLSTTERKALGWV